MRKPILVIVFLILLSGISIAPVSTQVTSGVKNGDWIEYNVTSIGAPNQGHDVEWARMEVTSVQNSNITVTITSRFTDKTNETITSTLNLKTGHLIDDFIIPPGLSVGDNFPDENYGNVTITGSEVRTYAGATRTVLTATMGNNSYVWDQETGVSVEGNTTTADYDIHSIASATNMWTPTPTQVETTTASAIIIAIGVLVIFGLILLGTVVRKRKK